MHYSKFDITVYITTKNRSSMLEKALHSIFIQDFRGKIEVIVVDDGSTLDEQKKNAHTIRKYKNQLDKLEFIVNEVSMGACYARNQAIFTAKAEFITGLDDDDEFMFHRLSDFYDAWDEQYSFLCSNILIVNEYTQYKQLQYHKNCVLKKNTLLFWNYASSQIFTRTERLQNIKGFNVEVKKYQDWDTWLRLAYQYGSFKRIAVSYIMHDHNTTPRVSQNTNDLDAYKGLYLRNKSLFNPMNKIKAKIIIQLLSQKNVIFTKILSILFQIGCYETALLIIKAIKKRIYKKYSRN